MHRAPKQRLPGLLTSLFSTLLVSATPAAFALDISGSVSNAQGQPVAGALVTVFNTAKDRKETVYTAADGSYALRTAFTTPVTLRARAHRYADAHTELATAAKGTTRSDFRLQAFANAQALSDSLTASAHLTRLQWPDDATRTTFVSQCNYCHQVGNALTRAPREKSLWEDVVTRMEGYGALLTFGEAGTIADGLHRGFDGTPVNHMQKSDAGETLARAKVREWHVGDGLSFVHDADVGHDGLLYGTDQGHDVIWVLDRRSGRVEQIPQPDIDLPQGGKFAALQLPLGVFTGKHGPHSLAQGRDGRFWITNALSSTLMSFDPKTRAFKAYGFDEPVLYPHTVRIDAKGIVWFTAAVSNKVVRFDPATETSTVIQLPHNGFGRWLGDVITPHALEFFGKHAPKKNLPTKTSPHRLLGGRNFANLPYGIDVNPKDGAIWYTKLFANKLGRIDPVTLAVEEIDTPLGGPRRPRFDGNGILWVPAFDDSALMRFDPATRRFEIFKLPVLAPGEYETPYALNVHPQTGEIWITSNMADRVLRFSPKTKTFTAYPSPTRVTWLRDMVFTAEGEVCSSSSNLPAYGIEDGRGAFICIDPEGGAQDRAAILR